MAGNNSTEPSPATKGAAESESTVSETNRKRASRTILIIQLITFAAIALPLIIAFATGALTF